MWLIIKYLRIYFPAPMLVCMKLRKWDLKALNVIIAIIWYLTNQFGFSENLAIYHFRSCQVSCLIMNWYCYHIFICWDLLHEWTLDSSESTASILCTATYQLFLTDDWCIIVKYSWDGYIHLVGIGYVFEIFTFFELDLAIW